MADRDEAKLEKIARQLIQKLKRTKAKGLRFAKAIKTKRQNEPLS
jgi:hypothetical protein